MTSNPLFHIPHYLRVFQTYLGARMYLIFGLALFAVVAEGVGILMLLPLLGGLDGEGAEPTGVAAFVQSGRLAVGLDESTTWLLVLITAAFIANGYRAYLQGLLLRFFSEAHTAGGLVRL